MTGSSFADKLRSVLTNADPRRSLAASTMWLLIIALAVTFFDCGCGLESAASPERVSCSSMFGAFHFETDQLSSDLGQALSARLDAVRAAGSILQATNVLGRPGGLAGVFDDLVSAYPQLDWIAIADSNGFVVRSNGALQQGDNVDASPWFSSGLREPWLGVIGKTARWHPARPVNAKALGDVAIPVREDSGRVVGVIAAQVSWRRAVHHAERLTDESDPGANTELYVLDRDGVVLIGPDATRGKPWNGIASDDNPLVAPDGSLVATDDLPRFERLPDSHHVLVSRALVNAGREISPLGWQVQLSEPNERVFQRANALALRILWVSMCLGAATALFGTFGAWHLTGRLTRLTLSVASVLQDDSAGIEIPRGVDEVARLGSAFDKILGDLQQERNELERRVALRTREVERFAEESRYAAIVRERLKIARDLHDTLAHSMMAMLSEIRLLRRLQTHDPASLPDELARAEQVAHEGLQEARAAITQMRVTAVRETGLGQALTSVFERFINHTGLSGDFSADVEASRFGDERSETILRIAQEALRNVERHARASGDRSIAGKE